MTVRSSRQLAERVEIDFYKRRNRFRLWTWSLALAAAVLSAVWLVWAAAGGNQSLYVSGPISTSHAMFENDCAKCHEQWAVLERLVSFDDQTATAPDEKCLACHAGPAHHSQQQPAHSEIGCGTCHHEHRGDVMLAWVADRQCVGCHGDLEHHGGPGQFVATIERFEGSGAAGAHPEFAIHRLLQSPARDSNALADRLSHLVELMLREDDVRSDPQAKARYQDGASIRFNHQVHLQPRYGGGEPLIDSTAFQDENGNLLDCQSCHEVDAAGRYMRPIHYETHCASCHPLYFDNERHPQKVVPHETADVVRGYLTRLYTLAALNQASVEGGEAGGAGAVASPAGLAYRGFLDSEAAEVVQGKVTAAERRALQHAHTLFGRSAGGGCRYCHEVSEPADGGPWQIVPPRIPERWLVHSRFGHDAHRMLDCTVCHRNFGADTESRPAYESRSTGDVLLPTLAVCLDCHSGRVKDRESSRGNRFLSGARSNCVQCHTYHDHSGARYSGRLGPNLEPAAVGPAGQRDTGT